MWDFFGVHISLIFEHILFYEYFVPSVCRSGYKRQEYNNTDISRLLFKIEIWFIFVKIHLINDHLKCKYSVRLSVGYTTKDIQTIWWKFSFIYHLQYIFLIISKSFATYGYCLTFCVLLFFWKHIFLSICILLGRFVLQEKDL